jgi:hypothetical protein
MSALHVIVPCNKEREALESPPDTTGACSAKRQRAKTTNVHSISAAGAQISGKLVARGGFANWQVEVLAVALQHVLTPSSKPGTPQKVSKIDCSSTNFCANSLRTGMLRRLLELN